MIRELDEAMYKRYKYSLINRYNYLYKYAAFVLAQLIYEHKNDFPGLCEDVTRITGIDISNDASFDRQYIFNSKNLSIFHLVLFFFYTYSNFLFSNFTSPTQMLFQNALHAFY